MPPATINGGATLFNTLDLQTARSALFSSPDEISLVVRQSTQAAPKAAENTCQHSTEVCAPPTDNEATKGRFVTLGRPIMFNAGEAITSSAAPTTKEKSTVNTFKALLRRYGEVVANPFHFRDEAVTKISHPFSPLRRRAAKHFRHFADGVSQVTKRCHEIPKPLWMTTSVFRRSSPLNF